MPPPSDAGLEDLRRVLRTRLADSKDTIRTFLRETTDGAISTATFVAAVEQLRLGVEARVAERLFAQLARGADRIQVRDLQKLLFGTQAVSTEKQQRRGRSSSALALAVQRGVRPASTSRDERATQQQFAGGVAAAGVDAFAWEEGKQQHPQPWLAGDARFEAPEVLERRVALLRSGPISRACRQFWDTFQLQLDNEATLSLAQYEQVHRLLTRALAPEMTEAEWREAAADDWRDDLRGRSAMTLPLYLMSIFEIADLWTDTVEEWQYVVFINKLYRRVTKPRTSRKKLWRKAGEAAAVCHAITSAAAGTQCKATPAALTAVAALARQQASTPAMNAAYFSPGHCHDSERRGGDRGGETEDHGNAVAGDEGAEGMRDAGPGLEGVEDEEGEGEEAGSPSQRCFRQLEEVVPIPEAELPNGGHSPRRQACASAARTPPEVPARRHPSAVASSRIAVASAGASATETTQRSARGRRLREVHSSRVAAECVPPRASSHEDAPSPSQVVAIAGAAQRSAAAPAVPASDDELANGFLQSRRIMGNMGKCSGSPGAADADRGGEDSQIRSPPSRRVMRAEAPSEHSREADTIIEAGLLPGAEDILSVVEGTVSAPEVAEATSWSAAADMSAAHSASTLPRHCAAAAVKLQQRSRRTSRPASAPLSPMKCTTASAQLPPTPALHRCTIDFTAGLPSEAVPPARAAELAGRRLRGSGSGTRNSTRTCCARPISAPLSPMVVSPVPVPGPEQTSARWPTRCAETSSAIDSSAVPSSTHNRHAALQAAAAPHSTLPPLTEQPRSLSAAEQPPQPRLSAPISNTRPPLGLKSLNRVQPSGVWVRAALKAQGGPAPSRSFVAAARAWASKPT